MTPPTLPGDIPGLLRRGSPAVQPFNGGRRCIVDELGGGTVPLARVAGQWFQSAELALDLSDPTGRAHAAWWLAGALPGARRGQTRAHWSAYSRLTRIYRPSLHTGDGMHAHQAGDWLRAVGMYDGWTASTPDARYTEALRRVVLHVAGRTD